MEGSTVFKGKRVSPRSFNGRLRKKLNLPCKQLYFYPDIDKNEKEKIISWEITRKLKNGIYEILVTTTNRSIHIALPFIVWMQKPTFFSEVNKVRVY